MIAITSVGGDNATKDMIRASIDVTDTYSFYQAKSIRQTTIRSFADDFEARLADPALPGIRPAQAPGKAHLLPHHRRPL